MSADPHKVRAVFDCMVFLQGAARRESPAGMCLLLVELGAVELCVSKQIIEEIRDVLTRPRVRQRFSTLTDDLVNQFVEAIERQATLTPEVPRAFAYERDPKDEPYINLALATGADYLVTRDNDLLDLSSNLEGQQLRQAAPRLRILGPVEFLLELERA